MSTSFWLDQGHLKPTKTFDIVIVGAGISGASVAYWLKKEDPSLKIALVEKHRLAFGATGRNAGFVTCGSVEHFNRMVSKHGEDQALEIWRFAEENMNLLQQEVIQGDTQLEFEQKGAYSLAAQDNEFQELKDVADIMIRHNIPVELCSEKDVLKQVGAQNFVGGIRYVKDGAVNPVRLTEKILSLAPVDLLEQTEVHRIEEGTQGTRLVFTDRGVLEAQLVVSALNGYSSVINSYFDDKIYPTRGQILMMEPVEFFMQAPCYANFYLDYFRQLESGHLLIGGFRQLEKDTEVGYSDHISEVIQRALHDFVKNHLPQFQNKQVSHRWAGIMGFSKDGEPMVGSLPNDPQVFFCGGYTGHGIGMAFHTGKKLVDLIFGRPIPDWLSSKRF